MDDKNLINKMNNNLRRIKINKINNKASLTDENKNKWLHKDTLTYEPPCVNENYECEFEDDEPLEIFDGEPLIINDNPLYYDNCEKNYPLYYDNCVDKKQPINYVEDTYSNCKDNCVDDTYSIGFTYDKKKKCDTRLKFITESDNVIKLRSRGRHYNDFDVFIYEDDIESFSLYGNTLNLYIKPKHGETYYEKFNKSNRKFYKIYTYIYQNGVPNFLGDEITVCSYCLRVGTDGETEITVELNINKHEER
ncbi:hypothetical protein [Methanosphaera sp.]|uniref:hypothetical protein n=1 Tax=Methanosphaera sp. TaxID=2666342 RepID=UPI0025DF69C1|nr:hypothetical protein [Methanosphaera sp.]